LPPFLLALFLPFFVLALPTVFRVPMVVWSIALFFLFRTTLDQRPLTVLSRNFFFFSFLAPMPKNFFPPQVPKLVGPSFSEHGLRRTFPILPRQPQLLFALFPLLPLLLEISKASLVSPWRRSPPLHTRAISCPPGHEEWGFWGPLFVKPLSPVAPPPSFSPFSSVSRVSDRFVFFPGIFQYFFLDRFILFSISFRGHFPSWKSPSSRFWESFGPSSRRYFVAGDVYFVLSFFFFSHETDTRNPFALACLARPSLLRVHFSPRFPSRQVHHCLFLVPYFLLLYFLLFRTVSPATSAKPFELLLFSLRWGSIFSAATCTGPPRICPSSFIPPPPPSPFAIEYLFHLYIDRPPPPLFAPFPTLIHSALSPLFSEFFVKSGAHI